MMLALKEGLQVGESVTWRTKQHILNVDES